MADSIFTDGALEISDESLQKDLPALALSRLLYQFQNSFVLRAFVESYANRNQDAYAAFLQIFNGFQLSKAIGAQLDVLGRIVGQARILLNAAEKQWFGFDEQSTTIGGFDQAPLWQTGAPLFGDLPADDDAFRRLIFAKIFKNHVKGSTVPELIQFAKLFSGYDISIHNVGPMEIVLIVPDIMPYNDVVNLRRFIDDKTADKKHLMPIAATVRIADVVYRPPTPFAFDRVGHGFDQGALAQNIGV